jgi:hypothetical protein
MIQCPCENCICIPICKRREYTDFISKCSLIDEWVFENSNMSFYERSGRISHIMFRLKQTQKFVNSIYWKVKYSDECLEYYLSLKGNNNDR